MNAPVAAKARRDGQRWLLVTGLLALCLLAFSATVFLRPVTVSAAYTHDVIIVFDTIHRIWSGQLPHVDFASPVGALTWVLPGLAKDITGSYAGAIETASVALLVPLLAFSVLMLRGRCGLPVAILFLIAVTLMVVVPLDPGLSGHMVSPAMHYNRWGWAALAIINLGLIQRDRGGAGVWSEALIISLLLGFLFYLKITYFIFGALCLLLPVLEGGQRRRVGLIALGAAALLILGAGLGTGILGAYLTDLREGLASSGASRRPGLAFGLNIRDILLALTAGILAISLAPASERGIMRPLLAMLLSGILIIDQNHHVLFIFALVSCFVLADHSLRRTGVSGPVLLLPAALMAAFVGGYAVQQLVVANRYLKASDGGKGPAISALPGLIVGERENNILKDPPSGEVFEIAVATRSPGMNQPPLRQGEYAYTVEDGAELLRAAGVSDPILVFDFLDSFSVLLDLPRTPGGYAWIHPGRNISQQTAPSAEVFFQQAAHVMWPLVPRERASRDFLDGLYADYLRQHFSESARSATWILFSRTPETDGG